MRSQFWITALAALGLAGGLLSQAPAQTLGTSGPNQGRAGFSLDGTVDQVDIDRDRVILHGDDGRTYTLDTYHSTINLRDTTQLGQTGDLVPGMRLHIRGTLLSRDLVEAQRVSVMPYRSTRPTLPAGDNAPNFDQAQSVTLRGTVDSVDNRQGSFLLRINDHTRRVFLADDTDISALNFDDSDRIPLHPGDRVSVAGRFQSDGTVLAKLVTPRRLDEADIGGGNLHQRGHILTGRIVSGSDYFSRDIKVRLSVDREIKVRVPHGANISSDGRSISVHDLHSDQIVRLFGDYDGTDFKADRIDVLNNVDNGRYDF